MKRLTLPILVALAAVLLAGCGGGGGSADKVQPDDVVVVGPRHITQADFDNALAEERASLKAQGQTVPKAGSTDYATMKSQIVAFLAQQAEFAAEADKLGITISDKAVQTRLDQIKKQYFGGSEKKYQAQLKAQGFTDAQVRGQIQEQLLEQALFNKVTKTVKASDADVHAYYLQHLTDYKQPASRAVREILVGKNQQALATLIYTQLQKGASFDALAKKYSKDTSSANTGGKYTAKQGSDVPEFDAAVFSKSAKTNQLLKPVNSSQYGWFVIKPVADIVPGKTSTEKEVAATIRAQLLQDKRNTVMTNWVTSISKNYCKGSQIKYGAGFEPSPDPCAALTSTASTATT
jgi:foldase protein PrsA